MFSSRLAIAEGLILPPEKDFQSTSDECSPMMVSGRSRRPKEDEVLAEAANRLKSQPAWIARKIEKCPKGYLATKYAYRNYGQLGRLYFQYKLLFGLYLVFPEEQVAIQAGLFGLSWMLTYFTSRALFLGMSLASGMMH